MGSSDTPASLGTGRTVHEPTLPSKATGHKEAGKRFIWLCGRRDGAELGSGDSVGTEAPTVEAWTSPSHRELGQVLLLCFPIPALKIRVYPAPILTGTPLGPLGGPDSLVPTWLSGIC